MDEKKNELQAAREQLEREKMTRRAALRKLGLTTGMSIFGLFAVDDLARMVISKMQEHEATKKIAEGLAHEFKDAGAVFALVAITCDDCCTHRDNQSLNCLEQHSHCVADGLGSVFCQNQYDTCKNNMDYDFAHCSAAHCGPGEGCPFPPPG